MLKRALGLLGILCLLVVVLTALPISASAQAIASPAPLPTQLAVLPGLGGAFGGQTPDNLGIEGGKLAPCPPSPNCVVSDTEDDSHAIAPIAYTGDRDSARETLLKVLKVVPRTRVVEQSDNYIRVEFTSRLLGFVDDGEFYLPANKKTIDLRSASRLGESDLGVNRRRMEQIRLALQDLGA